MCWLFWLWSFRDNRPWLCRSLLTRKNSRKICLILRVSRALCEITTERSKLVFHNHIIGTLLQYFTIPLERSMFPWKLLRPSQVWWFRHVPSENSLDYIILFRIHQNACRPAIMFVWLFLTAQRPRDFYADRHEYDQPTATGPIGKWTSELARNLHIRNVLPWESQTWEWDCVRNKQR